MAIILRELMHGISRLAALSVAGESRLRYSSFAMLNNSLRFPLRSNDAVFSQVIGKGHGIGRFSTIHTSAVEDMPFVDNQFEIVLPQGRSTRNGIPPIAKYSQISITCIAIGRSIYIS